MIVIQGQKWPYSYGMGPKMVISFNFPGYFAHLLSSYSRRNLKEDYAGCTVTITEVFGPQITMKIFFYPVIVTMYQG